MGRPDEPRREAERGGGRGEMLATAVASALEEHRVPYTLKPHRAAVFTAQDAARERGVSLSQIVKTMVGRDTEGQLHVALVPGDRRLKLKRLRRAAGGTRIELVAPGALAGEFDLVVGAISPLQLLGRARFYVDPGLLIHDLVAMSAGEPGAGILLSPADLLRVLGATVCEIASGTE